MPLGKSKKRKSEKKTLFKIRCSEKNKQTVSSYLSHFDIDITTTLGAASNDKSGQTNDPQPSVNTVKIDYFRERIKSVAYIHSKSYNMSQKKSTN